MSHRHRPRRNENRHRFRCARNRGIDCLLARAYSRRKAQGCDGEDAVDGGFHYTEVFIGIYSSCTDCSSGKCWQISRPIANIRSL